MSIVAVIAPAPWGPVQFETFADIGELLRSINVQPAHVEDVGNLDPEDVAEAARQSLGPMFNGGHSVSVPRGVQAVKEALRAVQARVVAAETVLPVQRTPESQDGAMPAFSDQYAPAHDPETPTDNNEDQCRPEPVPRQRSAPKDGQSEVTSPPDIDPAAIRRGLKLTQAAFAATFGLSVGTIRDWEQGLNTPDRAARALLAVIAHRPDVVREALGHYG